MARHHAAFLWVLALAGASEPALSAREVLDEAWWTGPLLAASPATLPQGHMLVEPYFYDSVADGVYDSGGARHAIAHQNEYGSLTYVLYGLTDSATVGVIPKFGFNDPGYGQPGSGMGIGDLTIQGAYRLSRFLDQGWLPALSLVIAETLPTGRYDHLAELPSAGMGAGAYTTTVSVYSQYYLWLPNGRILRTRLNVSQSWSARVGIEDVSVYGTTQGFRGHASPGDSVNIDSAWEYSVTRKWVAALDLAYVDSGSTRVMGEYLQLANGGGLSNSQSASGSSQSLSVAPAIEYNWSSTAGIIFGAKWVAAGRNTGAAVVPIIAINLVFLGIDDSTGGTGGAWHQGVVRNPIQFPTLAAIVRIRLLEMAGCCRYFRDHKFNQDHARTQGLLIDELTAPVLEFTD